MPSTCACISWLSDAADSIEHPILHKQLQTSCTRIAEHGAPPGGCRHETGIDSLNGHFSAGASSRRGAATVVSPVLQFGLAARPGPEPADTSVEAAGCEAC